RLTLALLFLLGVATSLWANGAPPRFVPPMPPAAPKLVVEVDEKATDARLVIPRQFLLRRAELEKEEPQEKQKAALPLPKIMVGLSRARAVSFGGLGLVRRKGVSGRGLTVVLVLGVLVAGSGYLFADLAIPRDARFPPKPPVEEPAVLLPFLAVSDNLKIEIV